MRHTLAAALCLLAACKSSSNPAPAAGSGSSAPAAPAAPSAGGGSASIDLKVSGAVSGSSKELSKADCVDMDVAPRMKTAVLELYPVIGGKNYDVFVQVKKWEGGAVSLTLPADAEKLMFAFKTTDTSGTAYVELRHATGNVTMAADMASGKLDLTGIADNAGATTVDLTMSYRCPAK